MSSTSYRRMNHNTWVVFESVLWFKCYPINNVIIMVLERFAASQLNNPKRMMALTSTVQHWVDDFSTTSCWPVSTPLQQTIILPCTLLPRALARFFCNMQGFQVNLKKKVQFFVHIQGRKFPILDPTLCLRGWLFLSQIEELFPCEEKNSPDALYCSYHYLKCGFGV